MTDWPRNWPSDRLTEELNYCLTDRQSNWVTDWVTGWLSNVLTDWLCDWQTDKSIKWLTDLLTEELAKWLSWLSCPYSLTNWLIDWLINWLICFANHFDWLTEQLSYRLTVFLKGGYYHLPSMPCAFYGVIFYGLWYETWILPKVLEKCSLLHG